MTVEFYSYSDDQLATAIADSRSWRGAARALGIKGVAGGGIRRVRKRAEQLHLDTSHFTGQRTWTDAQLRDAVRSASSWADVIRGIGVSDCDGTRTSVKARAIRLGLDISLLRSELPRAPTDLGSLPPTRTALRVSAEPFAVAWFLARGVGVTVPSHPCDYDLLITLPNGTKRVQVKTSTFHTKHGTWTVTIGQRPYVLDKSASRKPYDPDALDYFFVIDGDLVVYLIPINVVAGLNKINVGAYQDYRVGDASSLFATAAD